MTAHELQLHFEAALQTAHRAEDSQAKVATALVRALALYGPQRHAINEAYAREDI